jgi:hypothetical protein
MSAATETPARLTSTLAADFTTRSRQLLPVLRTRTRGTNYTTDFDLICRRVDT